MRKCHVSLWLFEADAEGNWIFGWEINELFVVFEILDFPLNGFLELNFSVSSSLSKFLFS